MIRPGREHVDTGLDVLAAGGSSMDTTVYVPELSLPFADSYMVPAIETRPGQTGDDVAFGATRWDCGHATSTCSATTTRVTWSVPCTPTTACPSATRWIGA